MYNLEDGLWKGVRIGVNAEPFGKRINRTVGVRTMAKYTRPDKASLKAAVSAAAQADEQY